MKAMILTAGEGTRLRPLTDRCPKPMLPLAGRPLLYHTLDLLALHGVRQAVVNLFHAADAFEAALRAEPHAAVQLHLAREPRLLGTAGAVGNVSTQFRETFFLIYGDNLVDVDLEALLTFHRQRGAVATIGLFPARDPSSVGVVLCDRDGRVREFREKPKAPDGTIPSPVPANSGIYVLEPEALEFIPAEPPSDWGHDVFPALLRAGAPVMARFLQGHLRDTGTADGFRRAHGDLLNGRLPRLWRPEALGLRPMSGRAWAHATARVARDEDVRGPALLGAEVVVDRGARVGYGTVLGVGARLERGSRVTAGVIGDGGHLERGAVVDRAIVGARCRLESGCHVKRGVIIGENSVIRAGVVVAAGTRVPAGAIWP